MNYLSPIINLLSDIATHCKTVFSSESTIDMLVSCTRQFLAVLCVSLVVGLFLLSIKSLVGRRNNHVANTK